MMDAATSSSRAFVGHAGICVVCLLVGLLIPEPRFSFSSLLSFFGGNGSVVFQ